jgi:predicted metal-dependent hydrolase
MHRQWINQRVADLTDAQGSASDQRRPTTIDLRAADRKYWIEYQATDGPVRVHVGGEGWLIVRGESHDDRAVARALRSWLIGIAHEELGRELSRLARQYGFQFSRAQVRRQRTRWGSCSVSGTISLNMCLLFQSPAVARYLLVHELCHTRHMNHSRTFWSLVESIEPDYRALDRELLRGWRHVPGWMFG